MLPWVGAAGLVVALAVVIYFLFLANGPPSAQPDQTATVAPTTSGDRPMLVTTQSVKVFEGPGKAYRSLGLTTANQEYDAIAQDTTGNWLQFCCIQGDKGWIERVLSDVTGSIDSLPQVQVDTPTATPSPTTTLVVAPATTTTLPTLTSTPSPQLPTPTMSVRAVAGGVDPVDLRTGPGIEYPVIGQASAGSELLVIGRNSASDWLQVCCATNGLGGWISRQGITLTGNLDRVYVATSGPPPATATPTPTPTSTPSPLPTATSTPRPAALPTTRPGLIIDDFEGFSGSLDGGFEVNKNAGNEGQVRLVGIPHVSQGRQALALEFDIRNQPPNHYIGFDRSLPQQDWSGYASLCFWIESDGSNRSLVLQYGETKLKFWKQIYSLTNGTGDYCISLQEPHQINLRSIGYYGVYVEGPPTGQSVIYVDQVRLVN